ncbi:MAG: endonuclease/exonuclease/phosphatase family protein [Acidobacteriota bacterium]|nr:endonuclease/exonuclease/phosphatase family protein [Acidobacteriota bacterium]MDQ5838059.1 endonuclease/exonuclease/phosphatase family protein [Acidobacteriota bacterium]
MSAAAEPAATGDASLRVVTYNVHKCAGLDRRVRPARVAAVLREIDADLIALQEVVSVESDSSREAHQARFIAEELGCEFRVGENRRHKGGAYGNVVLTRLPVLGCHNYDITWRGREPRGALRVDLRVGAQVLHLFNVHLGTAFVERRHQGRRLVSESILRAPELAGPRLVVGDFNEWTHGLASRLLAAELTSADVRRHLRTRRTYPGVLPFLHLDHVYHDAALSLERLTLHRSRLALVASDHLPLVADFRLSDA